MGGWAGVFRISALRQGATQREVEWGARARHTHAAQPTPADKRRAARAQRLRSKVKSRTRWLAAHRGRTPPPHAQRPTRCGARSPAAFGGVCARLSGLLARRRHNALPCLAADLGAGAVAAAGSGAGGAWTAAGWWRRPCGGPRKYSVGRGVLRPAVVVDDCAPMYAAPAQPHRRAGSAPSWPCMRLLLRLRKRLWGAELRLGRRAG